MLQLQSRVHLEVGHQVGGGARPEVGGVPFQSLAAEAWAVGGVPGAGARLLKVGAAPLPRVAQREQLVATMEGPWVLEQAEEFAVGALP
jgi:hypothetical protein